MKYRIIEKPKDGQIVDFIAVPTECPWPYDGSPIGPAVAFVADETGESPITPLFVSIGQRSFNIQKIVSFAMLGDAVRIWFDESAGGCNSTITYEEYRALVEKMVKAGLWLD